MVLSVFITWHTLLLPQKILEASCVAPATTLIFVIFKLDGYALSISFDERDAYTIEKSYKKWL